MVKIAKKTPKNKKNKKAKKCMKALSNIFLMTRDVICSKLKRKQYIGIILSDEHTQYCL